VQVQDKSASISGSEAALRSTRTLDAGTMSRAAAITYASIVGGAGLLVAPLTVGIPYHAEATPPVAGRVVDETSRQSVRARLHFVDFPDEAIASEPDGRFRLPAIRRWERFILGTDRVPAVQLVAEAAGYEPATITVYFGDDRELVIPMKSAHQ
jgi:hypothetical protein